MSGFEVVFGAVTGGAGLVSLGLQLGDCARKLNRIYHQGKDAPKSLQRLSFDLETMAMCLQMLEQHRQHRRQNPATGILIRCITACQQATNDIQQVVDKMTRRMEEHARLRGRLYFVFKEQDIQQLLIELERAKSSIEFAYMMYQAEAQRQRDEALSSLLKLHGHAMKGLQKRITDASDEIVKQAAPHKFPLASSATTVEAEFAKQVQVPCSATVLSPNMGRCHNLGTISQCGLNFDLKTYNVVSEKSPIFHFCETGDLGTVQKLVHAGEAGLLDIREPNRRREGERGFQTLLECAAQCGHLHICQYLLDVVVWPDQAAILSSALSLYSTDFMYSSELALNGTPVFRPPLYRLFIETPEFDMSVDEILEHGSTIPEVPG